MKRIKFGTGFTIFLLFFGIALLESFQSHNWIRGILWIAIGFFFLVADNLKRHSS